MSKPLADIQGIPVIYQWVSRKSALSMSASHCEVCLNSFFDHEQKEVFVNDSTNMTRLSKHILDSTNHIQPARQVMQLFTAIFERLPMVWVLIGLLFNATGLYLGFEFSLSFVYLIVGWSCCAYGLALVVFRLREHPRTSKATRLSQDFISAGSTVVMPAGPNVENEQATEQLDTE